MKRIAAHAASFVLAALLLAGCASAHGGAPLVMPAPSPGDTEGQIMSVTGEGFTICGISQRQPGLFDVIVCGDVGKARAVLDARFPGRTVPVAYHAGDGGPHAPAELVTQFWVGRTTGGVTSTRITANGMIDVGVDGDLAKARAVLDQRFPGWTVVRGQPASHPL